MRERVQIDSLRNNFDFKSLTIEDDPLVANANERIEPVRRHAAHVESILLAMEKAVFQADETDISIEAINLDIEIPVALAGSAPFFVNDNGTEKEVVLLMNIVPSAGNTLVILGALNAHKEYVKAYKTRWMAHALSFLSMIESWMINGTDQWCLKPSVWNALPKERQERLSSQLFSDEKNIAEECDVSIFDDIRKNLIKMFDTANSKNMTKEYLSFIEAERKKMV